MSSEDLVAEGQGDTLGEAKWAAMKELEARFPGLTQDHVSFDVTEDGGSDGPVAASDLAERCRTGEDANRDDDCRVVGIANSVQAYWRTSLRGYEPELDTVGAPASDA